MCKGSAHDTRKGRRRHTFRLPCAYLWLSPPSARSARRLRLLTIRFEQNPPAGWPSSSAAVLRSGRSVRRRRRTAGWQAKQHAIEEHGYESCLRRQLAHHHRRGRAADACCSGRRQNRAGSSRWWPWCAARQLRVCGMRTAAIHSGARRIYGILGTAIVVRTRGGTPVRVGVFVDVCVGVEDARAVKPLECRGPTAVTPRQTGSPVPDPLRSFAH